MNNLICIFFGHKKLERPREIIKHNEGSIFWNNVEIPNEISFTISDVGLATIEKCKRCNQIYLHTVPNVDVMKVG